MSRSTVTASLRRESGKGPARRLRAAGQVPAVLYGGGQDPVHLALDPKLLLKAIDPELKRNTLLQLDVKGEAGASCLALVKEAQVDSLHDQILHVDLIRVTEDQPVQVKVPLELTGRAEGLKIGGVIQQVFRELPVRAPAGSIPVSIQVDTSPWAMNYQLRAADLALPPGVSVLLDPKQKVAALIVGHLEDEKKAEDEGEAEAE